MRRSGKMQRSVLFLVACLVWVSVLRPGLVHAQVAVIDVANVAQTTITAVESVLSVANEVLELTPLGGIEISDDFASDMDQLTAIVNDARLLSNDVSTLQAQLDAL